MTNKEKQFENIFDLIGATILFDDENRDNEWGKLKRKHYKQAKKEMRKFIINKNIEWDGDNNIISLGKHFKIKLL